MFKKILCISASLVLCLTCFIVPSFADTSQPFNNSLLPVINDTHYNTNGLLIAKHNSTNYYAWAYTSDPCYVGIIRSDYVIAASRSEGQISYRANNPSYASAINLTNYNSTYDLYYGISGTINASDHYVPFYSTNIDDDTVSFLSDLNDYLGSSSESSYSDTISINPGQVAYIGFPASANYFIHADTVMPKLSSGGSWSDSPQRWGASDSLPISGTSFPISGSNQIQWYVNGSTNIFGQGVDASWNLSNTLPIGYRFIYVYNPWYYQQSISSPSIYSSNGNLTINTNPITLEVEGYSSIRIFNLQQTVTGDGVYISNSISGFNDYTDVIPSDESGTGNVEYQQYIDGNASGDPSIINGTNNNQYNPNPMTVTEHIQQVTQVLSNFANSLIELIKAPISHVANLIQAGSGFMSSLRGMYAWLPVDIQGLVTSALTLVIGIGVFKVFL